jgi:hypothetical protein
MTIHALFLRVFLACYAGIFLLKLYGLDRVTKFIIPVFVLGICLYSLQGTTKDRLISLALFFAFVGDSLINLSPFPSACIIPFALTHVCLIVYYLTRKTFALNELLTLVPILLLSGFFYDRIRADIPGGAQKAVCLAYLGILDIMVWRAGCLLFSAETRSDRLKVLWGSVLFYITDVMVCLYTVYHHRAFIIVIWSIYPTALGLLSMIHKPILRFKSEG